MFAVRLMSPLALLLCSRFALAGGITVEASAGEELSPELGEPSTLVFVSSNPRRAVDCLEVLGAGVVRGSGYSSEGVVPIAGYARYTAKLCQTPCRLRLDPGFYHLQLGDGLTSPTLDFTTTGRDYAYSVKPERVGLVIGGIVVSSVGFGTAFSGVILGVVGYAVGDDGLRTTGVGVAIGGTALGLLGIPMFRAGRSSYREIPVDTAWAQFEG